MPLIVVCDSLSPEGLAILATAGTVETHLGLAGPDLAAAVASADAIVVRSSSRLTAEVIEAASRCRVIARAGVGVDNIDVAAATRRGILVVNSPAGNILAAAEHALALLMSAARHVPQADRSTRAGGWDRKSFQGTQLLGKTLGLVGLGRVGREVAVRARAMGMMLVAHDPFVTPERAAAESVELIGLDDLLQRSDFVSLHAAATAANDGLIGPRELGLMKPSAVLVNTARGTLVDEAALAAALREGKLAGAALDVFAAEPPGESDLFALPNVIVTPHVGALTSEAQVNVAVDAARQVADVLAGLPPRWPVNAPALPPEVLGLVAPLAPLAHSLGRLGRALLRGPLRAVELRFSQEAQPEHLNYLTAASLAGLLEMTVEGPVNVVNAALVADELHIAVNCGALSGDRGYTSLVELGLTGDTELSVAGALLDRERPRLVSVDGIGLDLPPTGLAFLIWRRAFGRPGFVGRVGTLLGAAGVNISAIQVGQDAVGEVGLMALTVDSDVPPEVLAQVEAEDGVVHTRVVDFD